MSLKFVSLHNHSGHSVYDAIGSVQDLAEFMLKNSGEDSGALAITEHGQMNSVGSIVAAQQKYDKKNTPVKFIYGVESYYIPSIEDWHILKQKRDEEKKEEKKRKKEESQSALVIEDEKESKSRDKFYDPINRRNHLVLLAINQIGLKNLFRLVSRSYREGFYRKPRIDFQMLQKHNEGLIASSACLVGISAWCSLHPGEANVFNLLDKELLPVMNIFGKDRFFLELQFNKIPEQQVTNKHLIEYAKKTGYSLIATADAHYPSPQLWRDRELYRMLGYQMLKSGNTDRSILEKEVHELEAELYLKNGDQIFQTYKETFFDICKDERLIKEAIERTYDIAHDFIGTVTPDSSIKLPKTFQVTEEIKTPFDKIKSFTLKALKEKKLGKQYVERVAYELGVIKKLGVEEYFLAKLEIVNCLKKHMLMGCSRGSSAGSLVCYLLGITLLDPIKNGLLFERFISTHRKEMPDIDSDWELKEQILDILKEHFGEDNVLAVTNYNRLQLKSLVKDISRLYEIPYEEVNKVTKIMETEARSDIMAEIGHDSKLYEFTFGKAKQYSKTLRKFLKQYSKIEGHIENLYQEIKSIGKHAGAVLIIPDAESCLPVIKIRGIDQSPVSEGLTAQHLHYFGVIKFDELGLTTLKIIRKCIEEILQESGTEEPTIDDVWDFYNKNLHPDVIDSADSKIFKHVYWNGRWPSIFQFAEKDVQMFCNKAKPECVNDIAAVTSIWRPGSLKSQGDRRYLWANEPDKIKEFKKEHPVIQEVLGKTRGILCFQEQFQLLANKLAGFSLEEADNLRKLLSKPATSLAEEIKKERIEAGNKFINGCIEKGLTKERAERLWNDEILPHISYSFNKSHAISYSYNSYQCAYLYTYYPKHWIKSCLECDPDKEKTINVVRQLGYIVSKPDVNTSSASDWYISENNHCIPALMSLKGIGSIAANELVKARPKNGFKNIDNFFWNKNGDYRWSKLNKKVLQILIKMEAFNSLDCIGPDKLFKNYRHMNDSLFEIEKFDKIKNKKVSLEEVAFQACSDDWTVADKICFQKEISGFFDKNLIVGEFLATFQEFNIGAIDEVPDEKSKVNIWGLIERVTEKTTKKGKPFLVVSASGISERPYFFKVWNTSINDSTVWKAGNVIIYSLNYSEQYGYSLREGQDPVRVTK